MQNFGLNTTLNQQLAQATGYTGDFGGGQFGAFLEANPQLRSVAEAIQNPTPAPPTTQTQNFGQNDFMNRQLAAITGYTGNFGGGEYGRWLDQQSPEVRQTADLAYNIFTDPLGTFSSLLPQQEQFDPSQMFGMYGPNYGMGGGLGYGFGFGFPGIGGFGFPGMGFMPTSEQFYGFNQPSGNSGMYQAPEINIENTTPGQITPLFGGASMPSSGYMQPSLAAPFQSGYSGMAGGSSAPSQNPVGIGMGYFKSGGPVKGPGSEKSDSIPAMLSDGEFVMTAKAVRGAGGGSREKGFDRMEDMMKKFEKAVN